MSLTLHSVVGSGPSSTRETLSQSYFGDNVEDNDEPLNAANQLLSSELVESKWSTAFESEDMIKLDMEIIENGSHFNKSECPLLKAKVHFNSLDVIGD